MSKALLPGVGLATLMQCCAGVRIEDVRGKLSASLWVFPGVWFLAPICLRSACMQSKSWWVLVARNLSESVKNHYAAQPPFPNPCMPHGSQMEACDQTRHSTTRRLAVSVSATKYRLCYVRLAERVSLSHSCLLALSLSLSWAWGPVKVPGI